jgi:translation initiation factor IF-2
MDYLTKYYKNLSEELERRVNLLEMMVAQATPPSTPPTPAVAPPPTPPAPTPGPAPTPAPPSGPPPQPDPGRFKDGTRDPGYGKAFDEYYRWYFGLNPDDRQGFPNPSSFPKPGRPYTVNPARPRPGGGTIPGRRY